MISKFLEQVDEANPERSKYKIAIQYINSDGKVEASEEFDVDGVSYAWRKYDDAVSMIAGDAVEDGENALTSSDVVSQAAGEYHDSDPEDQKENKPGQRAADADESLDTAVNIAVDEIEQRIRQFETRKKV